MTGDGFWVCIESIDRNALDDGDEEAAVQPLVEHLATMDVKEIQGFEEHLAQVLYQLDGRRYADNAGQSGKSGDGFLYVRCYVVGRGKEHYERVLADPARMPKSLDQWFESLLYASQNAWSQVTGRAPEEWEYYASVSYETGSNQEGWH